jgi:hypothetical protein
MKDCPALPGAFVRQVSEPPDDAPVRADHRPDTALSTLRVAIVDPNQFTRNEFIGALAHTHTDLMAIPFASVSDCVGFSADLDVILLRVGRGSSQTALEHIEQLRSAFPGVPVMALSHEG